MNSSNIASLFLLILIILNKSDALARVLLASESPNPEKDTQNPDPQNPVDPRLSSGNSENVKDASQFKLTENNTKDKRQIVSKDTSSNKYKTTDISKEIGGKSKSADGGKEENEDPLKTESIDKNEDLKGKDGTTKSESKERDGSSKENKEPKGKNDSSQGNGENNNETKQDNKSSQDNGESKVESKESNGTSESKGNNDTNGKPKESNDPSNNPEIGKKNDELKENNGTTNSREDGKMSNDSKKGNDPSNNKEKVKKNEKPVETNTPSEDKMNDKNDAGVKEDIGPHKSGEKDKGGKKESKDDGKNADGLPTHNESLLDKSQVDTCDISLQKCQQYELVACLQHSEIDSRKLVISVQNTGDDSLTVNITVPPSVKIDSNMLNLAKHSSQKIGISSYNTKSLKVVLNAGKGECTIQIGIGPSIADWFQQFPAYASQVTPTYVAYSLIITLIIVGVVFGFCKFRRRGKRIDNGVQYQQLEMGNQIQPSNSEVVEASTVEGWNQGWDDDWDEEEQVPNSNLNGNLSSNGLSSRPVNRKSDWDVDWDE